ncbi:hypothetical protein [Streptomyces sp. NRRL WC-3618]|uniref:hypothetical protein n=1 Tax=Streptomyces sp. NRRL WC-3618 TaxID=1519490 RepID=UPI000B0A94B2|nr:hypothetical protein [Streptomyces sp. NRRL WC-3618]
MPAVAALADRAAAVGALAGAQCGYLLGARAHRHAAGARKRGQSRGSLPAASALSPTTTASGVRAAD